MHLFNWIRVEFDLFLWLFYVDRIIIVTGLFIVTYMHIKNSKYSVHYFGGDGTTDMAESIIAVFLITQLIEQAIKNQ